MWKGNVLFIIVHIFSTIEAHRSMLWQHKNVLNDNVCHANITLFMEDTSSAMACLSVCASNSQCHSAFYNENLKTCRGCSDSVAQKPIYIEAVGFVGYEKGNCLQK